MGMFKRKVLYLGGFDPRGARFYHRLCAEQIARLPEDEAAVISARRKSGTDVCWQVASPDGRFTTEHEFLVWDDLVRRYWVKGPRALLTATARAYWHFIGKIDWKAARAVHRGAKITLFYPGASMLLPTLLIALILTPLLALLMPWLIAAPIAIAAGVALTPQIMQRLHSKWLLRFIIFNDMIARKATDDTLDSRIAHFTDRVDAALGEDWDEILFITHSNGSILAMPVIAALLERHGGRLPDHFHFVTLGSTIQLVALRRDAHAFHATLDKVMVGQFDWLDIGSLTDGACIPLVDPGVMRPVTRPAGLRQFSPRWFRYCDPATYEKRRRDKYETHFEYLRRLDRPSPLDYVGITCGDRPLGQSIAAFEAENS